MNSSCINVQSLSRRLPATSHTT